MLTLNWRWLVLRRQSFYAESVEVEWFPPLAGPVEVPSPSPQDLSFLRAAMFELDRRWGKIRHEEWVQAAKRRRCPFAHLPKPPFYNIASREWLRHFSDWEEWDRKHRGARTRQLCRQFHKTLEEGGWSMPMEDRDLLEAAVVKGLFRKKEYLPRRRTGR